METSKSMRIASTLNGALILMGLVGAVMTKPASALTSGPSMPEYTNFEPVDAPDLVDLTRGSFSYQIPLLNVPGPGLSFPVTLTYHAGIGVEQEASWVGLGWNVEAGAISRKVNNIPDDYKNDHIVEALDGRRDYGFGFSISTSFGHLGAVWHNGEMERGSIGFGKGIKDTPFNVGLGLSYDKDEGLGVTGSLVIKGQNGMTMGQTLGINQGGGSFGLSVGYLGMMGLNGTIASNNSGYVGASLGGTGATLASFGKSAGNPGLSYSKEFSGALSHHYKNMSSEFLIPAWGGVFVNTSSWDIRHNGYSDDGYFGFLYADATSMGCTPGQLCNVAGNAKKMELNQSTNPIWNSSGEHAFYAATAEDMYSIQTQGVSGIMKPFRTEDGDYVSYLSNVTVTNIGPQFYYWPGGIVLTAASSLFCQLFDLWCDEQTSTIDYAPFFQSEKFNSQDPAVSWRNLHLNSTISNIQWRYLGEPGGGLYTNPDGSRDDLHEVSAGSRRITPFFRVDEPSKIGGWRIVKEDGMQYLYSHGLYNDGQVMELSDDESNKSTQTQSTPYAYTWLLTAILSPDYVPVGNGFQCMNYMVDGVQQPVCLPKNGDIGGWIRFEYTGSSTYGWQFSGDNKVGANLKKSSINIHGTKDVAYLRRIVTPTHKAEFNLGTRKDGRGAAGATLSNLESISLFNNSQAAALSKVVFLQDYSLSPNTENSIAPGKGKLTLKGIKQISGSNGPSFVQNEFQYGYNPAWDRAKRDYWGFYCATCGDVKEPDPAGTSKAWSLTKIVDAMGKATEIEYETNRIDFIGDRPLYYPKNTAYTPDLFTNFTSGPQAGQGPFSPRHILNNGNSLKAFYAMPLAAMEGPQIFNFAHIKQIPHPTPSSYLFEANPEENLGGRTQVLHIVGNTAGQEQLEPTWDFEGNSVESDNRYFNRVMDLSNNDNTSGLETFSVLPKGAWFGYWDGVPPNNCSIFISDCQVGIAKYPMAHTFMRIWALYQNDPHWSKPGGGPRVAKLKTTDPIVNASSTVSYTYSGGSTAVMPGTESYYHLDFAYNENNGEKMFAGFPGVIYKSVEVKFVEEPNWGTEKYRFITPHDAPITRQLTATTPHAQVDSRLEIVDMSPLWGQLWKKTSLDKDGLEVARMEMEWGHDWSFKPSLARTVSVDGTPVNGAGLEVDGTGSKFGQTQSIYSHRHIDVGADKRFCYPYISNPLFKSCLESNGLHTTQVVSYKVNPYVRKVTTVSDRVSRTKESNRFDYLTGQSLLSIDRYTAAIPGGTTGPQNQKRAASSYSVPAYRIYNGTGEMRDRNMLTQIFSTTTYDRACNTLTDPQCTFQGLTFAQWTDPASVISSTYTDWDDQENGLFRKRESFALTDRTGFFLPGRNKAANGANWRSGGRSRFDAYGHEVEYVDNSGKSAAALYGYNRSLWTASIRNGTLNGAFHESFEYPADLTAKTSGGHIYVDQKTFGAMTPTQQQEVRGVSTFSHFKTGKHALAAKNRGQGWANAACLAPEKSFAAHVPYVASVWWFDRAGVVSKPMLGVWNFNLGQFFYAEEPVAAGDNTWKRMEVEFEFEQPGTSENSICLYASYGEPGPDVLYDELRVAPKAALMTTYAYDVRGQMLSTADENEVATHFDYDAFGNLTGTRTEEGFVLSEQAKKYVKREEELFFPEREASMNEVCLEPVLLLTGGAATTVDFTVTAVSNATLARILPADPRQVCTRDKGGTVQVTISTPEGVSIIPLVISGTQLGLMDAECAMEQSGTRCVVNVSSLRSRIQQREGNAGNAWVVKLTLSHLYTSPMSGLPLCFDGSTLGGLPGDDALCTIPQQLAHLRMGDFPPGAILQYLPSPTPTPVPASLSQYLPPGLLADRVINGTSSTPYCPLKKAELFDVSVPTTQPVANWADFRDLFYESDIEVKKNMVMTPAEIGSQFKFGIFHSAQVDGGPHFVPACLSTSGCPINDGTTRTQKIRIEVY